MDSLVPKEFEVAIMKEDPSLQPQHIIEIYTGVRKAMGERGLDITQVPADQLARLSISKIRQQKGVPPQSASQETPVKAVNLDAVPGVSLPTGILTPEQTARNSAEFDKLQGFQANNNSLDPTLLKDAYAKQADMQRQNLINSGAANTLAGMSSALGNKGALTQQTDFMNRQDKIAELETTAPIIAAAKQYEQGQVALGKLLDMAEKSGKFEIDASKAALEQKKLQAEIIPLLKNAQTAREMSDPNSQVSKSARELTIQGMMKTNKMTRQQAEKIIGNDSTAVQVAAIATANGVTLDQITKDAEIQVKKALEQAHKGQAAASYAQAEAQRAEAAKRGAETESIRQGQDINALYTGVGIPGRAAPAEAQGNWDQSALGNKPPLSQVAPMSVTTSGGTVSLTPAQHIEQKRREAAKQVDDTARFIGTFDSRVAPVVRNAYTAADKMAGRRGENYANIKNDPAVVKYNNDINTLNAIAADMGLIAKGEGNKEVQSATAALGSAAASTGNPAGAIGGTILSAASPFFGSSQPLTKTSPPEAIKDMVTKIEVIKAQQQKLLPYQRQFAEGTRYGAQDRFYDTPIYKSVMNAIPVQNKNTGEVVLIDRSNPADLKRGTELLSSPDWQEAKGYTGNVR